MFAAALKKGNGIKYTPVRKTNKGGGEIFSEKFLTPRRAAAQPLVFRRRRGYFRNYSPLKNARGTVPVLLGGRSLNAPAGWFRGARTGNFSAGRSVGIGRTIILWRVPAEYPPPSDPSLSRPDSLGTRTRRYRRYRSLCVDFRQGRLRF